MAQSTDNTLSNQSGASFRTELNSILAAHLSNHKGSSEPSYITTGGFWIDDTSTPWVHKIYDGAASFGFLEINPSTNNVTLINVKDGDARTEGASIGQIQDSAFHVLGSVSGTNTITASLTPAIAAYAAGQSFNFVVDTTNTGAVTINVNSLGAKAIQKNGAALVAGDLTAGDLACIIYDGTQFQLVSPARTPVLTAGSITTAKIADDAVTAAKIGSGAARDGQVLTADGAGGAAFENVKKTLYVPVFWPWSTKGSDEVWLNGQTIGNVGSGADLEDAEFETLFNMLVTEGATYGNTGSEVWASGDTVKLPDYREVVIAGLGTMGGVTSRNLLTGQTGGVNGDTLGAVGGEEETTPTEAKTAIHDHVFDFNLGAGSATPASIPASINYKTTGIDGSVNIANAGSSQDTNNIQPTLIQNFVMRYK